MSKTSPMPEKPVVANNTPLSALWSIGRLDLLGSLFGEVLIPEAVYEEFLAAEQGPRLAEFQAAPWLKVTSLSEPRRALAYSGLDRGEAEVMALAEERSARLVIIDERKGRRYARRMGFPLTGTLGVLLLAKEAGLVDALRPCIQELEEAGMHLAPALVARVIAMAGEDDS